MAKCYVCKHRVGSTPWTSDEKGCLHMDCSTKQTLISSLNGGMV